MTKPRIQKMYFPLLFFEHQYLAYYDRLTSIIFNRLTIRKQSYLVNLSQFSFINGCVFIPYNREKYCEKIV